MLGTQILGNRWNVDDLIRHLRIEGAEVGKDNDGQIILYTGLFQAQDGSLYSEPQND